MKIYNSLSRQVEEFKPLRSDKKVGVYACGPTVYFYPQIGNWRAFATSDLVVRSLKYFGYDVHFVMNITDVGHLTGDNLGDADMGEDRLEKGAKREGKTAWDVAKFYTADFEQGFKKLNLIMPTLDKSREGYCVATDHIKEQIEMVMAIEKKGYTYKISDGIYFDVLAYEKDGNEYGRMSNIHKDKVEARLAENTEKKDQRDFALWKFSYASGRDFDAQVDNASEKRHMEWPSPWGLGFPGWHIECSAMSVKYLGEQFDIHLGGEDHKSTHHPNEIVQAEVATGKKPFVNYWMHTAFLQVDGGRMGKSLGNAYSLQDVEARDFKPEHLRYFYLSGHYRQPLNFTWESLLAAKNSYQKLIDRVLSWSKGVDLTAEKSMKLDKEQMISYEERFQEALNDDLNMPKVLALVWDAVKNKSLSKESRLFLLLNWDDVLGLGLEEAIGNRVVVTKVKLGDNLIVETTEEMTLELTELLKHRAQARIHKDWAKSDEIRKKLGELGYAVVDREGKVIVSKV